MNVEIQYSAVHRICNGMQKSNASYAMYQAETLESDKIDACNKSIIPQIGWV